MSTYRDPSQPIATRPLAIQKNGTWYTYGHDLTKNICEIYGNNGYINTSYRYSPFGKVVSSGNVEQPIQWSSEFLDQELSLVYFNYRYYNYYYSIWLSKDKIEAIYAVYNQYLYNNNTIYKADFLGLWGWSQTAPSPLNSNYEESNKSIRTHNSNEKCCNSCNNFLKTAASNIRIVFSANELDEEHCTYDIYCKSNTKIMMKNKDWEGNNIGGYEEMTEAYIPETWYRDKSAKMTVVINCNSKNKMETLIHEMQHAVDDCHNKNKEWASETINPKFKRKAKDENGNLIEVPEDLIRRMKKEISAYSRAEVSRIGKTDSVYYDELFNRVMKSVLVYVDENMRKEIKSILRIEYDKIKKDYIKEHYKLRIK